MSDYLFTIGYSTHTISSFVDLLKMHSVTALADVRSAPYSKFKPEFNKEILEKTLKKFSIYYAFLGEELGARCQDPRCYSDGRVDFSRLAQTDLFKKGISRLIEGMKKQTIALMCAEKDPIMCHRTILVSRYLGKEGISVLHILESGKIETTDEVESRLIRTLNLEQYDLFAPSTNLIDKAYKIQEQNISFESNIDNEHNNKDTQ